MNVRNSLHDSSGLVGQAGEEPICVTELCLCCSLFVPCWSHFPGPGTRRQLWAPQTLRKQLFWDIVQRTTVSGHSLAPLMRKPKVIWMRAWHSVPALGWARGAVPSLGVLAAPAAGCHRVLLPVLSAPAEQPPPGAKWLSSRPSGHTGAGSFSHTTPNKMFGVCHGLSAAALTSNSFCFPPGWCPARALPSVCSRVSIGPKSRVILG